MSQDTRCHLSEEHLSSVCIACSSLCWQLSSLHAKRNVWLPNWQCSMILLLATCKSSNSAIPSARQMQDTGRKLFTHLVSVPVLCMVLRWVQPNSNQLQPKFCMKLLWSCLPSPGAPSLRMSSVNSGFWKYSCPNSWKFVIRTSSRPYYKILATICKKVSIKQEGSSKQLDRKKNHISSKDFVLK
jgi:hypothetical protein